MRITHFSNSFILVESGRERLVCDPWMGPANGGGWQSFPEFPRDQLAKHLEGVQWVYISHLHDDHLDPHTLKTCGLLGAHFIIKRFATPTLRDRLKRLGVVHIHELDSFTPVSLGEFTVCIFPQMTSNSSDIEEDVNYDLDTSIAIKADGTVFFNQVDNPLSIPDLVKVHDWIASNMGPIDVASLVSGAASEYPHLFIGISQEIEKKKIIDRSLDDLVDWLRILRPRVYFPAGGTYLIPGFLSVFNDGIAQPSFAQIERRVGLDVPAVKPIALEGGQGIDLTGPSVERVLPPVVSPITTNLAQAISTHAADHYWYESQPVPEIPELFRLLRMARENWRLQLGKLGIQTMQSITFKIYMPLNIESAKPDVRSYVGDFLLQESSSEEVGELIVHIDARALMACITRRMVWNGTLGSLCLFERRPNRFFPNDTFSLNYLCLSHDQICEVSL